MLSSGTLPVGDRPPRARRPAGLPAGSVTYDDGRQTMTTDTSDQNNTGPFGGPVIIIPFYSYCTGQYVVAGTLSYRTGGFVGVNFYRLCMTATNAFELG